MRSPTHKRFGGLERKVLLLFLAFAVLPLWLSHCWRDRAMQRSFHRITTQNLRALAALQGLQIQAYLKEKKQRVQALTQGVRPLLERLSKYQRPDPTSAIGSLRAIGVDVASVLRALQLREKFAGLALFDHRGVLVYQRSMAAKAPSLSRTQILSPNTDIRIVGTLHFKTSAQTRLRLQRSFQASPQHPWWHLVVDLPFTIHQRFLQEKRAPAFQGMIYLLDAQQHILCGSLEPTQHKSHHHVFGQVKRLPFLNAEKGTHTATSSARATLHHYRREDGAPMWGLWYPLSNTPRWSLLIELPEAKACEAMQQQRRQLWRLGLVFCFVLIAFLVWITRRLTSPLRQLQTATESFRVGHFEAALPPAGDDEVGDLTRAFEVMGRELSRLYTHLEEEVQTRTEELREAQRFSELLFQAIPDLILVLDKQLTVIKANRKAITLFGQDLIGRSHDQLFADEDSPQPQGATQPTNPAALVLASGIPHSDETREPHPHNKEYFYRDLFPITDEEGDVIGVLESAKIVTQQRELMVQAIHREKMAAMGVLASSVAHEIGNPLASIYAVIQRLKRQSQNEEMRTTFAALEERCALITRILHTLRDHARKRPEQSVLLQPQQELERALALLRLDRRMKQLALEVTIAPDLPMVRGQADALVQIFANILRNALDATAAQPTPRLTIRAWPTRQGLRIQFHDNGPGIPSVLQERALEAFVTTKEDGTGLGLSISRTLLEALHGSIRLQNSPEGGALIEIDLPSSLERPHEASHSPSHDEPTLS